MADYYFEFTGHVDETRRPKDQNFPKEIFIKKIIPNINDEQARDVYNNMFSQFVTQAGIVVILDESTPVPQQLNFDRRVYVPWHMITHFHGRVEVVQKAQPDPNPLDTLIPLEIDLKLEGKPN